MAGRDGKPFKLTPLRGERGRYRDANVDNIEKLAAENLISQEHRWALNELQAQWINASRDSANELSDYVDTPVGVGQPAEVLDSLQVISDVADLLETHENRLVFNLVRDDLCPTYYQMGVLSNAAEKIYRFFSEKKLDNF